jgi:hypothetical protein
MTDADKTQLLEAFPETPPWILALDDYAEAVKMMELRRRAFPKSTPQDDDLEAVNARLASRDYMIMVQSNGKFALYRVERGAIPMHGTAYDRYVKVGKSHATVGAALKAAERR